MILFHKKSSLVVAPDHDASHPWHFAIYLEPISLLVRLRNKFKPFPTAGGYCASLIFVVYTANHSSTSKQALRTTNLVLVECFECDALNGQRSSGANKMMSRVLPLLLSRSVGKIECDFVLVDQCGAFGFYKGRVG